MTELPDNHDPLGNDPGEDPLGDDFHRLQNELRALVPIPPAAGLRARALHRLRVRRVTTVAVAGVAVVAVALGGAGLLLPTAGPPAPPIDSPTPPPVDPTEPPPLPEVTPSPRPAPQQVSPPDDPIAAVDWREATITFPPEDGCPAGPVGFVAVSDGSPAALGPADGFPKIALDATGTAYGDLTGDGRLEAVLLASCVTSEEGLTSGHGGRPLVVARAADGTLTALGRVGPPGADFLSWWVADGRLLIDADPWTAGPEDHFLPLPGLALAYRWDGAGFGDWEPAAEYPPLLPPAAGSPGPPVQPRAAGVGLGCPDAPLSFTRAEDGWGGSATAGAATYVVPERHHQPYLFDLDGTGERLLVVGLECLPGTGDAGHRATGLAVFERTGEGWQGISVLVPPNGYEIGDWRAEPDPDGRPVLRVTLFPDDDGESEEHTHRWNGTGFDPAD